MDDFKGKKGGADREVEVSMVYGTMRAAVTQKLEGKGKFKVKTPSATMGVRGTEFIVKSEISDPREVSKLLHNSSGTLAPDHFAKNSGLTGSTQVSVIQGAVDVGKHDFDARAMASNRTLSSPDVIRLKGGTQASAILGANALSAPKALDASQMKTLSSEARVVDSTFKNAVVVENNSGNGRSPASNGSGSSLQGPTQEGLHRILASTDVPLPPPPPVRPADINIPGALGPNQIFNQPAINTQGTLKRLRVVITTN
jgi:hypothetical protein